MHWTQATAFGLLLLLTGCGSYQTSGYGGYSAPTIAKPTAPALPITVKDDAYRPTIEFDSEAGHGGYTGDATLWGIYGSMDRKTKARRYYSQWSNVYDDRAWRFFQSAGSSKGERLEVSSINRNVVSCTGYRYSGCAYSETLNVYFTEAQMRRGAKEGLSVKMFARSGSEKTFDVPADVVAQLLAKMDSIARGQTPASSTGETFQDRWNKWAERYVTCASNHLGDTARVNECTGPAPTR